MKIFHSFLIWQLIIIMSLVVSGVVLSNIISENVKNTSIKRTEIIYSNFIIENVDIQFSYDDFKSYNLELAQSNFNSFFKELHNSEIIGIKVWANDATILYSNNDQIIGSKFPENQRYQKAISGEIVTKIRDYNIEEKLTTRSVDQVLTLYVPISDENNIYGVIETYIDPTFLNDSIAQTTTIVSFIIGIMVTIISIIIIINFQINKKEIIEPIKKIEKITDQVSKGNFKITIGNGNGSNEIKNLTKNICQMINTLQISRKSLESFKSALDNSASVAITDDNGKITYANDVFCKLSKYSREELIGKNHRILKSNYHDDSFYENMWKTITSGEIWHGDIRNMAKDGTFYWVRTMIMPIFNDAVNIEQYIAIRTDITSQVELAEKLVKVERMSSIGQLASRMSHDIRNPLSVIRMSLENLKIKYGTDEDKEKQFDKVGRSIDRIAHQIDYVLDFVKGHTPELYKVKFSEIITESIDSLTIPDNIKIIIPKNDVEVFCDKKQFSIVINNLILNGIQAIEGAGTVEITVEENNDGIVIQVKDSGKGIPKEDLKKVFEPLFTTRQTGTGLGLASVKSIIDTHGGIISVTSPPTIFTITLPKISD